MYTDYYASNIEPTDEDRHMLTSSQNEIKEESKSEDDYFDYLFRVAEDIY